jgi:hypothetical protein
LCIGIAVACCAAVRQRVLCDGIAGLVGDAVDARAEVVGAGAAVWTSCWPVI